MQESDREQLAFQHSSADARILVSLASQPVEDWEDSDKDFYFQFFFFDIIVS